MFFTALRAVLTRAWTIFDSSFASHSHVEVLGIVAKVTVFVMSARAAIRVNNLINSTSITLNFPAWDAGFHSAVSFLVSVLTGAGAIGLSLFPSDTNIEILSVMTKVTVLLMRARAAIRVDRRVYTTSISLNFPSRNTRLDSSISIFVIVVARTRTVGTPLFTSHSDV